MEYRCTAQELEAHGIPWVKESWKEATEKQGDNIKEHEGRKYLRTIKSPVDGAEIEVDVYAVLVAFNVTCPATAHAIKKLLAAGQRGKGDLVSDLIGAKAAVNRAIQLADDSVPNKSTILSETESV